MYFLLIENYLAGYVTFGRQLTVKAFTDCNSI
jgi:hypothetical protein